MRRRDETRNQVAMGNEVCVAYTQTLETEMTFLFLVAVSEEPRCVEGWLHFKGLSNLEMMHQVARSLSYQSPKSPPLWRER